MTAALIVTIFVPIICGEFFNEQQELHLIRKLNKFFNCDHNIFLLDSSTDITRLFDTKGNKVFTPRSVYVIKNIGDNITGMENLRKISSKNTFLIVSPDSSNFEKIYNLLNLIKKIQRLQIKMKIGLFFQDIASSEDLQKLFQWSWEQRIINIFATTYLKTKVNQRINSGDLLNIFSFNPFGTFDVINVTSSETFENVFLRQKCNFQQYPLRVLRYNDSDYFWPIVFRVMNASYTQLQYNSTTRADVMENQFDFVVGKTISVYPPNLMTIVEYHTLVIVVPQPLPFGEFASYLQAIIKDTFFAYSLIIIIGIMLTLSIVRYITQKRILFFESVADVINLLMNDNTSIKYQQLHRSEVFLIGALTFAGLIIVNGILSNLQSYLTQPVLQHQINTIEDIYNSPLPIVAQSEGQKTLLINVLTNVLERKDWENKIFVDKDAIDQAKMYNRSIIFLALLDTSNELLRVQRKLGIRGYYVTETHIRKYFNSYHVHKAFPFIERLNEIIHRLQSAGLYDEWKRREDHIKDKKFLDEKRRFLKTFIQTDDADEIERFPIPKFIGYGWIASIIMLIVEIIWKNFRRILDNNFKRLVQSKRLRY